MIRCPDGACADSFAECDPPDLIGNVSFQQSFPDSFLRTAEKDHIGFYIQDSYRPLPNLSINAGLRIDRDEAEADGWVPFDPREEASQFMHHLKLVTAPEASSSRHDHRSGFEVRALRGLNAALDNFRAT